MTISDDGRQYAFVVDSSAGQFVHSNGLDGKTFQKCGSIEFSPVSSRLFYWAVEKTPAGGAVVLVADGKVVPTEYASQGWLRFSKDGKRWAIIGGCRTIQEGNTIRGGAVVIYADGKGLGRYSDASLPDFSPDGRHIAYLARDNTGKVNLYVDGKSEKIYADPEVKCSFALRAFVQGPNMHILYSARYLSDGRLLVVTQDKQGWLVYRGNEPIGTYIQSIWGGGDLRIMKFSDFETSQSFVPWSITPAAESPVAVWWERMQGKQEMWHIVKDGKPVDTFLVPTSGVRSGRPFPLTAVTLLTPPWRRMTPPVRIRRLSWWTAGSSGLTAMPGG